MKIFLYMIIFLMISGSIYLSFNEITDYTSDFPFFPILMLITGIIILFNEKNVN
ncbi:MAG: hypothetical protein V1859_01310 [archaeon]